MLPKLAHWRTLFVCLFLIWHVTASHRIHLIQRQDENQDSISASGSENEPEPTATASGEPDNESSAEPSASETAAPKKTASETDKDEPTSTASNDSSSTSVDISTDGNLDDSTFRNVTLPPDELPIKPVITPGWGVAGTILLLTGLVYGLIGIKNRTIHTFFSTAFIIALGVTVLIVYVTTIPVSNAAQGGYVVAAVLSGCALGTASIFFKELTEGFGCALGGFCLSMWLLCLVPGGLLDQVASKAIFISCFTVVGFAFYFSRFTRDWALIVTISFAGATAVVLGIDCFSRAGLKEFWAYVWQLNDDLFPLGANTYPVTKGIRVETAAIIIIFLAGIISQIKLWRIVREKRTQRDIERAQGQRNMEQEETEVGRQVEETNNRDREEWERAYGNGEAGAVSVSRSSDELNGGEKVGACRHSGDDGNIEMSDMSDSVRSRGGAEPLTEKDEDGKVIVRVAADDLPVGATAEATDGEPGEKAASLAPSEANRKSESIAKSGGRHSLATSAPEAPEVVPLPFTVPADDEARPRSERSSVATFADDEDKEVPNQNVPTRSDSFARRLSQGSSKLLRNLSHRSNHRRPQTPDERGESSEELVIPDVERGDDEKSSLAATMDYQSLDDESIRRSVDGEDIEISARLSGADQGQGANRSARNSVAVEKTEQIPQDVNASTTPISPQDTAPKTTGSNPVKTESAPADDQGKVPAADTTASVTEASRADDAQISTREPSEKPKSVSSAVSTPASLTKGHLPPSLSRIAMSYRTNEWAKHLSYADAPEPDELHAAEPASLSELKSKKEKPAPVNIEALQQGPDAGIPPAAMPRSDSRASLVSNKRELSRRDSKSTVSPTINSPTSPTAVEREHTLAALSGQPASGGMVRSSSSTALRKSSSAFLPIAEEYDGAENGPEAIPEEGQHVSRDMANTPQSFAKEVARRDSVPGVVSYSSPQTLLGQREMFIRSKSQGNLLQQPMDYGSSRAPSDDGSINNYPMYAAALGTDPDDLPLSQRKQMMHHSSSMMSMTGPSQKRQSSMRRVSSGLDHYGDETAFDSHQPKRNSSVTSQAAREAKLAQFRSSVAMDLRSGTPVAGGSGRETPFSSTPNLVAGRDSEVQRNIQMQRNLLLGQKEAEAQRREMNLREKQWADRAFDERMRSGELMDAHREAMRRMQQGAKK